MDSLGRFKVLIYMMVLLAILGFTMAEQNPALLIFSATAIGFSWYFVDGPRGRAFPRWLINTGVLMSSMVLFYELVISDKSEGNLLFGLGHFMVSILLCKMFEAKGGRDFTQILTLSLLVIVAGAIFGTSLLFGLLLMSYLMLGVLVLLLFFMQRERNKVLQTALVVPASLDGALRPEMRRDVRRTMTAFATSLIVFATIVFTVFPRGTGREILGVWAAGRFAPQTGFSDRVHFGDFGTMQQSDTVVMEVRIERGDLAIGSTTFQPYFRGMTLDSYDGMNRIWRRSPGDGSTVRQFQIEDGETAQLVPPADGGSRDPAAYEPRTLVRQHYTMHTSANNTSVLFGVFPAVAVQSRQVHALVVDRRDLMISYHGVMPERFEYDVDSPAVYGPGVTREPRHTIFDSWFGLPQPELPSDPVPPRIVQMAHEVAGDLDPKGKTLTPEATLKLCRHFEDYLRTHYAYSLNMNTVDYALDPTEDFLVNKKSAGGNCEYFASAMIMYCRAMGIKARMVTGYHGGEFNQVGGYYLVRQKYAHAWVEAFIDKQGWVGFDPSPASDLLKPSGASWTHWFSEWVDYVQTKWLSGIVFFDNAMRQQIVNFFKVTIWGNIVSFAENVMSYERRFFAGGSPVARYHSLIAGVLACGLFCVLTVLRRRAARQRTIAQGMLSHLDPAVRMRLAKDLAFFNTLLSVLQRAGFRRTPAQTPRELADRLQPAPAHPDAAWLVEQFYALRFGTVRMTSALHHQVQETLVRLRHKITGRQP
jgi:protein-glutamine gamma-glutamyltransferase